MTPGTQSKAERQMEKEFKFAIRYADEAQLDLYLISFVPK